MYKLVANFNLNIIYVVKFFIHIYIVYELLRFCFYFPEQLFNFKNLVT